MYNHTCRVVNMNHFSLIPNQARKYSKTLRNTYFYRNCVNLNHCASACVLISTNRSFLTFQKLVVCRESRVRLLTIISVLVRAEEIFDVISEFENIYSYNFVEPDNVIAQQKL